MTKKYHGPLRSRRRFSSAKSPIKQPGYGASLEIRPKLLVLPGSRAIEPSWKQVFFWGGFWEMVVQFLMVDFCWGFFGKKRKKQHLLLTKRWKHESRLQRCTLASSVLGKVDLNSVQLCLPTGGRTVFETSLVS